MHPYCKTIDTELIKLLREGDVNAFEEIHRRYYPVLYSHAYRRLPEREEVKDILQEVFTYLWNNRLTLIFETGINAYLYTCVRNRIINIYRHHKIKDVYLHSLQCFAQDPDMQTDERVRTKELVRLLEHEIEALPAKMGHIFKMSRQEQLSHKEIAEKLDISVFTVRKHINNSLKILRVKLGTLMSILL
ncbi:MAG: RNA polymerase sigma-70 factor [Sphingobacteriales bacterium]